MRMLPLLLAFGLLSVGTTVAAPEPSHETEAPAIEATLDSDCGGQPCGFITPILSLEFPTKQDCGGYRYIYADSPPEDCDILMAMGESMSYPGYITFAWDCAEEPTYPISPTEAIRFEFGTTANNPDWMQVDFEPKTFDFTFQDLYDINNYNPDPNENPVCWFQYEHDLTVTFTRTGDMDRTWERKVTGWNGLLKMFIKGKSSAVDPNYREAYGVEEFRWRACDELPQGCTGVASRNADSNEASGLALVFAMATLVAFAATRRR